MSSQLGSGSSLAADTVGSGVNLNVPNPNAAAAAAAASFPLGDAEQQRSAESSQQVAQQQLGDAPTKRCGACCASAKAYAYKAKDKCACTKLNILIALVMAAAAVLVAHFAGGVSDPGFLTAIGVGTFIASMSLGAMVKCSRMRMRSSSLESNAV